LCHALSVVLISDNSEKGQAMADRSKIASLDAWCAKLSVLREKANRYDDRLLLYLLDMAILQVEHKLAEVHPRVDEARHDHRPTNPLAI